MIHRMLVKKRPMIGYNDSPNVSKEKTDDWIQWFIGKIFVLDCKAVRNVWRYQSVIKTCKSTQKTTDWTTRSTLKLEVNSGAPKVWHPSCYSCYKLDDKSWMRKWPDCDYDKQNVFVVICYSVMVNWVMTSTYRNHGAVVHLLAATIYWENHGRSHKLWNIVSTTSLSLSIDRSIEASWQTITSPRCLSLE